MAKVLLYGKHGNVLEHELGFHVVDTNGKHVGYYTNYKVAEAKVREDVLVIETPEDSVEEVEHRGVFTKKKS